MASDLERWYTPAFEAFRRRSDYQERTQTYFFENKNKLGLTMASSVFSIGPGDGGIDAFLLANCMPNLKSYCAIDVDSRGLALLQSNIDEAHLDKNIKIRLVNGDAAEWHGYTGGADVILIFHVLYYMQDDRKRIEFLQRCVQWLNPGGRIILLICDSSPDDPRNMSGKTFGGKGAEYGEVRMKEDLKAAGLTRIDLEETYNNTMDFNNRDKALLNFYLFKDATEEEAKAMDDYFEEIITPGKMYDQCTVVLSVKKEDFTTNE